MAAKQSKQQIRQQKIRSLKIRQQICNVLFTFDLLFVACLALFSDSDMSVILPVLLVVAAGFFFLSRSTRQELAELDPAGVKARTVNRKTGAGK